MSCLLLNRRVFVATEKLELWVSLMHINQMLLLPFSGDPSWNISKFLLILDENVVSRLSMGPNGQMHVVDKSATSLPTSIRRSEPAGQLASHGATSRPT